MWNSNQLTRTLGIQYPLIQGPFGGGLSTVELLTTVSNAGGLGSYGAHSLSPEAIQKLVFDIRQRTENPFAINLWVSDHDKGGLELNQTDFDQIIPLFQPWYDQLGIEPPAFPNRYTERFEEQIEALLEAAPPVFSFVFGIPDPALLDRCRQKGIRTLGAATTPDEAKALDEAEVDVILATGFEAGGHRVSFLKQAEDSLYGTLALVPQIVDQVRAPVVAAGGIADARGVRAAMALGAQGVQMGTAFLACEESGTSALHREALHNRQPTETRLSRAFTGRLARFISNEFIVTAEDKQALPLPFPIQSVFTSPIKAKAAETGNKAFASLYASQATALLKHHRAADLFNEIVAQMSNSH